MRCDRRSMESILLESVTGTCFELYEDVFCGTSLYPVIESMSSESPANLVDPAGGLTVDEEWLRGCCSEPVGSVTHWSDRLGS